MQRLLQAFFSPEHGEEQGIHQERGSSAEMSWFSFELEYRYLSLKAASARDSTNGSSRMTGNAAGAHVNFRTSRG